MSCLSAKIFSDLILPYRVEDCIQSISGEFAKRELILHPSSDDRDHV